jgi:catechol 2,3-dioxygenase-like lactoylglutathione lyase family enzyme
MGVLPHRADISKRKGYGGPGTSAAIWQQPDGAASKSEPLIISKRQAKGNGFHGRTRPRRRSAVFSHIFVSVSDFQRALNFYNQVLSTLNIEQRFCEPEKPWAGWHSAGGSRPYFVICKPFNGEPHDPGNGQMVAFTATDRQRVRAAHQTALALGGRCEGPPGLRPHYHEHYYGAYFRDLDGNKVCVACQTPE